MGRWAEVYFTAAPENREEAVLALLRELESDNAAKPADSIRRPNFAPPDLSKEAVAELPELPPQDSAPTSPKLGRLAILPKSLICESCGQAVPGTQRFCGMCGAPMQGEAVGGAETEGTDWTKAPEAEENETATLHLLEAQPVEADELRETVFSFGGNVPEESVPYRYRIYVGAALVVLMVALLIMSYRATQDWSRSSPPLPQAAPSASSQPAAQPPVQPAAQPPAKPDAPAEPARDGHAQTQPDRNTGLTAEPTRSSAPPAMRTQAPQPVTRNAASVTPVGSTVAANQGNGSEELLVAERYLNTSPGKVRDSREAAKWLWQAVGKQNAAATLLLSDLYLKGDGVPKNCDQARLLLDAAARKGAPGAGERLRNLPAFGCQ